MRRVSFVSFLSYFAGCSALVKPDFREVDVAIVGGGATGSYAAVRLREDYGKTVLVIEKEHKLVSGLPQSQAIQFHTYISI